MRGIITVSGSAQHGKDTLANFMSDCFENEFQRKVIIFHYADFLKFSATKWFGWDGKKDEKGRSLLQYLGTDLFRKNRPDCWVNMAKEFILGLGDSFDYIIIPDTRFPNEIKIMKDLGKETGVLAESIKVIRDGFDNGLTEEQKQHPSETALKGYKFDVVIHNSGTLDDYKETARLLCEATETKQ